MPTDQEILTSGLLHNRAIAVGRGSDTALAMMRRAVALDPGNVSRRVNLATVLVSRGEVDEAESLALAAIPVLPQESVVWGLMGAIKTHRGLLHHALDCFKKAHQYAPNNGQVKFDLAAAYLRLGDFTNGFAWFEHRSEILPFSRVPPFPKWDGKPARHVLIWGDQGYGDKIQFARFLPQVRQLADKVTFLTDPNSVGLFLGYGVLCDIAATYNTLQDVDAQYCLSSLPYLFGTQPETIPPDPGLLSPAQWNASIVGRNLKVGIAWAGNPDHPNDSWRTVPFEALLPLANDPRTDLYSLQCGPHAGDIAKAGAQRIVGDMVQYIDGEWTHTAAVIQNLDLIVTVDTAIAHIAGALKKPAFVLVPALCDWRWGPALGAETTPWYPTMRLFRQERLHEWKPVVERICKAVGAVHDQRAFERLADVETAAPVAQEYEPEVCALMRRVLRPGDTFIDVGANVGKLTVLAAKLVSGGLGLNGCRNDGRVIAIEPGENNLPGLREATKGCPNVEVIPKAAWSDNSGMQLYENLDDGGGNSTWNPADWPGPHNPKTKAQRPEPRMVETIALDSLFGPQPPRLIKIDTEGAEQRVLEGAVLLMTGHIGAVGVPFIVAELHEFGLGKLGCSQESLRQFMTNRGYATFMLFADGSVPMLIPHGTRIETGLIVNLLFSTVEAVAEVWPSMKIVFPNLAPIHAYGLPPASAPKPNGLAGKLAAAAQHVPEPAIKLKSGMADGRMPTGE